MREICHKGLARLVGVYGSVRVQKKFLTRLVNASVEPDLENRQEIENNLNNLPNVIPILSKWLFEHTTGAMELAILNLRKGYNAFLKNHPSWISFLGQALHYITDWGTPYHSSVSLVNLVIPTIVIGGVGWAIFGLIVSWLNGSDEMLKSATKWGLLGAATSGGISIIDLYLRHKSFEEKCDKYWERYENMIIQKFKSIKERYQLPKNFEEAIKIFEEMMNDLRNICNNTSPDWILQDNGYNFTNYMVQIVLVMDFACQVIKYY